jgi:hypothetical protein
MGLAVQPSLFPGVAPAEPRQTPPQAKRASYQVLLARGLGDRQQRVLEVIRAHGPISDRAIGLLLGWPVNRVVPRRHELAAAGYIRPAGSVIDDETQRRVSAWEVV